MTTNGRTHGLRAFAISTSAFECGACTHDDEAGSGERREYTDRIAEKGNHEYRRMGGPNA
jgi:hypothetical protein